VNLKDDNALVRTSLTLNKLEERVKFCYIIIILLFLYFCLFVALAFCLFCKRPG
jgi:hypothetical protein